jgi:isoaspartyl peptidase/L-asparaginase-like protein (Ntn-hydrolase superfamily)
MRRAVLAVHGGAGATPSAASDPEYAEAARRGISNALAAGGRALASDGSAVEVVVIAVKLLEDCDAFNAGRGSVLTASGDIEMDAAVMDGSSGRAGAVAGVSCLANPVAGALAVMERSNHVLLAGEGAEALARECGAEIADADYFVTARRRAQLAEARAKGRTGLRPVPRDCGTVGAVACDSRGHLAAATSTGGINAKLPGRVSDSCLIGAGTWADDATCAISATGHGEFFIRRVFTHEVDALMRHAGLDLRAACEQALSSVRDAGGRGGCIGVDAAGRVALAFTTPGMPRGWISAGASPQIAIHPEDEIDV